MPQFFAHSMAISIFCFKRCFPNKKCLSSKHLIHEPLKKVIINVCLLKNKKWGRKMPKASMTILWNVIKGRLLKPEMSVLTDPDQYCFFFSSLMLCYRPQYTALSPYLCYGYVLPNRNKLFICCCIYVYKTQKSLYFHFIIVLYLFLPPFVVCLFSLFLL